MFEVGMCHSKLGLGCFPQTVNVAPWQVYHMIFTIMLHSYAVCLRDFTLSFNPQNQYIMLMLQPPIAVPYHSTASPSVHHMCGHLKRSLENCLEDGGQDLK